MTALLRGVRLLAASAPQPATARAFGTARFSDPADDGDDDDHRRDEKHRGDPPAPHAAEKPGGGGVVLCQDAHGLTITAPTRVTRAVVAFLTRAMVYGQSGRVALSGEGCS